MNEVKGSAVDTAEARAVMAEIERRQRLAYHDTEIKLGVVTLDDDFELSEDEQRVGEALLGALKTLRTNKPTERNERARRYAVTITEMEKVWAYFHTWVIADRMKGDDIR